MSASHTNGQASDNPQEPDNTTLLSGPGFPVFTRRQLSRLRKQHNVLVLVGNGFDLQILKALGSPLDTRYESFFYFLKMLGIESNSIIDLLEKELEAHQNEGGHENWSDIEAAITELSTRYKSSLRELNLLRADLQELQRHFASFLEKVVPSSLLFSLSKKVQEGKTANESLSKFLGDFTNRNDYDRVSFRDAVWGHDALVFRFICFNYTPLLDNYLFLDSEQFNPRYNKTVDTNFSFYTDPHAKETGDTSRDYPQSTYVVSEVLHPHGTLTTPRSILFGTDAPDTYRERRDTIDEVSKPLWAQNIVLHEHQFRQAELFIIFGCSLGKSDGWWWRRILENLQNNKDESTSELIIYWWVPSVSETRETTESVRNRFLQAADADLSNLQDETKERIHVIIYDDASERVFLKL